MELSLYDKICFNMNSFDLYDKFMAECIATHMTVNHLEEVEMYEDCQIMLDELNYLRDEFSDKISDIINEPYTDVQILLNEVITTTKETIESYE